MAENASDDIKSKSFEEALQELESIVKALEAGTISLDESINAYERGAALKQHCEAKLAEARMRVEKISLNADGAASASPVDLPE